MSPTYSDDFSRVGSAEWETEMAARFALDTAARFALDAARVADAEIAALLRDQAERRYLMDPVRHRTVELAARGVELSQWFAEVARRDSDLAALLRKAIRDGAGMALVVADEERKRESPDTGQDSSRESPAT